MCETVQYSHELFPALEECQIIADETLNLTQHLQSVETGKNISLDGIGLEGWRQFLEISNKKL